MRKGDALDPKGLIADSYRMEGIGSGECRTIFLDWALSMPNDADIGAALTVLLERHAEMADHPMTQVLRDGLTSAGKPRRRGGWRSRER